MSSQVGKDIELELDAIGRQFEPYLTACASLHASGTLVVWPGMLFPNSKLWRTPAFRVCIFYISFLHISTYSLTISCIFLAYSTISVYIFALYLHIYFIFGACNCIFKAHNCI